MEPSAVVMEKSSQDDRIYKPCILASNGLRCLLISDPTTDRASAAMDVRVGHLSDPNALPGLAHFLEHMLFLGTDKYPDENSYNAFLNSHGGSSNAFTDTEDTNYYFDISCDKLQGALDRFAQFFISPLFTPSATEREMEAVDSEHAKNLQNDFWRLFQLSKSLARPSHPFHKFGSGSLKTLRDEPSKLGINVRDELLRFHETFYGSSLMRLVVLGKEGVEELEQMVTELFSSIPDRRDMKPPVFPGNPFDSDQLGRRLDVVPVKDLRSLEMFFPIREVESLYLQKPTRYMSHLLGHEGAGSVLSFLKDRDWANELSAGDSRSCSDWAGFSISIELTDAGVEHVIEVVDVVFAYLALMRKEGPQRWIHDETSTVADCSFRFLSKRNPIDYTCSLAGSMQVYPWEHLLSGPYKIYEYEPALINECMSFLTPRNMILSVLAKTFEGKTDLVEEWYGTPYRSEKIPEDIMTRWEAASVESALVAGKLHFPEQNDMIASDFSLRSVTGVPEDEPRLLFDTATCRLWYKPDNVFDMPKLNVVAKLRTVVVSESPKSSVLSLLWAQILQEHSNEYTYLASVASLHCSFVNTNTGMEINVSGYNHKLNVLMRRIVNSIIELPEKMTDSLFERIKDKVSKQYANFLFSQPYQHALYGGDLCLELDKHRIEDKLKALETVAMEDVVNFSKRLLSQFHLEILVHGNSSPDEAKAIANTILDGLKPSDPFDANLPSLRVVELPPQSEFVYRFEEYNPDNTNSCIEIMFQVGSIDLRTNATLALLHHLAKEPAFTQLRTKEQLGYIVHTSIKTSGDDIKSLLFLIQSDSFDPIHLDNRIEAFLGNFRATVVAMSKEEFQANVDAVVSIFMEKNKNLGEESTKYWNVITNRTYMFRKLHLIAKEVETLKVEDVLRLFDRFVALDARERRKLCVQVFSKNHSDKIDSEVDNATILKNEDVHEFKRTSRLYPLSKRVDVEGMKMQQS